jgi:hypothetical protein
MDSKRPKSPSSSQRALSLPEQQEEAARTIQRWFRGLEHRRQALAIMHGHEKQLCLDTVDPQERQHFVEEVKLRRYDKVIARDNAGILAISALRANKITYEEASIVIESAQNAAVYGKDNIQFCRFLDEQGEFTQEGEDFLAQLYQRLKNPKSYQANTILPPVYRDETTGYTRFLSEIKSGIKKTPSANLFYVIDAQLATGKYGLNDFHDMTLLDLPLGYDPLHPTLFVSPAYSATDLIGGVLYGKDWIKKEYQVGALSINDILKGDQRHVRVASVAGGPVLLPQETHGMPVTAAGVTRHDGYHRDTVSLLGKDINKALARVRFVLQQVIWDAIKEPWSQEIWDLTDKDFSIFDKDRTSKERALYRALNFTAVGVENIAECNAANKDDSQGYESLEVREQLGHLVRNKNNTTVPMWIMVMDMVDAPHAWQEILKINIHNPEIYYDHHIALYERLKGCKDFESLDFKQKLVILDHIFHSFDKVRKPYDTDYSYYANAWEDFKEKFEIPYAEDIQFKKAKKGNEEGRTANSIYLQFPLLVEKGPTLRP